ncbi:MAG: DUF2807 domain-containing protein [Pseudomonadota bacterium]|nr:DUF2807 domain-containing protein [Pseudomonadota bacterium]
MAVTTPGAAAEMWSKTVALTDFHKLRVEGNAEIVIKAGAAEKVTILVPERQRRDMTIEVEDGVLLIRTHIRHGFWSGMFGATMTPPRITVVFRHLDDIEIAGAVKLRGADVRGPRLSVNMSGAASVDLRDVELDELRVEGSGAVKAKLAGHAKKQEVEITGAGKYDAPSLASDEARVTVSGAGRVIVRADKTLQVKLSGAGAVDYLGEPAVTQQITGAGRVRRQDAIRPAPGRTTS